MPIQDYMGAPKASYLSGATRPIVVPAGGKAPKKTDRISSRDLPVEDLVIKRWENPPPAHLESMVEAGINICYFRNEHFARRQRVLNSTTNAFVKMPKLDETMKCVVNKCNKIARDLISLRCKAVPSVGAEPTTYDERDKLSARVANYLIKEFTSDKEFQIAKRKCASATELTGIGVMYPYYDPSCGEPVYLPEMRDVTDEEADILGDDAIAKNEAGEPIIYEAREGRIRVEVGNMFSMRWESSPEDQHDAQWAMIGRVMHVDRARARFGDNSIEPDPDVNFTDFMAHSGPMHSLSTGSQLWIEDEYVFVREMYEKPSPDHPEGRYVVSTGKTKSTIIHDDVNPFRDQIPFVWFPAITVPDSSYPMTTMRLIRHLNKAMDKRISMWVDDANIMGRMKVLVARNCGLSTRTMGNDKISVLEYDPGFGPGSAPQMVAPPPMPAWVTQIPQLLSMQMDELAGMTDVMKGVNPPGSRSGTMLAAMQEQSHSLFYPMFMEIESGYEYLCQLVLRLAQMCYNVPRTAKCCGQDMEDEILEFSSADLEGSVRIKAVAGSAAPKSKNIRLQQLAEQYQIGLVDREQMKSFVEFALLEEANEDRRVEDSLIRWEHRTIMGQGIPVVPRPFENHQQHLMHHNRLRKNPKWLQLPQPIRDAFDQHCKMHDDFMRAMFQDMTGDKNAQSATMQQMMRPGGPASTGQF
jgi:hypothetical protein